MCIACHEFIKKTLTLKEFRSALWETTRENEEHLREVESVLGTDINEPDKLREKLSEKLSRS